MHRVCLVCSLSIASHALAAASQMDDYAQGITIEAQGGRPLIHVEIPDAVYRTVTRADLADLRVFNAEGVPVPHALCASPAENDAVVTQQPLPVFTLQAAAHASDSSRIELNTSGGTAVSIQESPSGTSQVPATQTQAHVIDARAVADALRSIQFEWRSPDEASEARVRIEASEDLDRWHTVVAASTLLNVAQGERQLRRESIPLPQQRYRFLRVARTDGGPPLLIASVVAERIAPPAAIEPLWFDASLQTSTAGGEWLFDAGRLAPVTYARLRLPEDNMSIRIRIQSRSSAQERWRERWSGESYAILAEGERRQSAPAQFSAAHDRYWRVLHVASSAPARSPTLALGYRPARLQFLAQGDGPYMLAFGSRRVQPDQVQQCGSLIADARGEDLQRLIEAGIVGAQRTLGGVAALEPLPNPTSLKRVVLWAVLAGGVALLIAMALSLLHRLRPSS